ncbi:MAG TPA: NAD-dependent protein deacetylase [Polyangia bacterium]
MSSPSSNPPSSPPSSPAHADRLSDLLDGRRVVALTGAGCSTESGIPDYRGPGRTGPPRSPILHDAFIRRPEVRQRYWARATMGWPRFSAARPNAAHEALAELEAAGTLLGVITQNVDRLHTAAGSRRVIELHGALADVFCLGCDVRYDRAHVHERLCAHNRDWLAAAAASAVSPDGDAQLDPTSEASFEVWPCEHCGGALKPDVVFFGGNVPAPRVASAFALLEAADVLLVIGSSLEVYSGFRFVRGAVNAGKAVAILNQGPTRGDDLAAVRIDARAGTVLPEVARRLSLWRRMA